MKGVVLVFAWVVLGQGLCATSTIHARYAEGGALATDLAAIQNQGKERTSVYPITHGDGEAIARLIKQIYPDISVSFDSRSHRLVIRSRVKRAAQVRKTVSKLNRPMPQIQLDVDIIEYQQSDLNSFQTALSNLSGGVAVVYDSKTGSLNGPKSFVERLRWLAQTGEARVLAKPRVRVLNNHEAQIRVGDRIPYVTGQAVSDRVVYQVHYLNTGIELSLTPRVVDKEMVEIRVDADYSSVTLWKSFKELMIPIVSRRHASTVVRVKSGETVVLAGLITETQRESQDKVPILGDIPFLGIAFQHQESVTEHADIAFVITPYIGVFEDKKKLSSRGGQSSRAFFSP
ncbi:hypothetical protein HOH87_08135 [bacterium]|jgi:general secretion pathway protein D|nr:hypothetical protein [bacterium]